MKEYKLEVIWPGCTYTATVKADHFTWSESGMYLFYLGTEKGGACRRLTACYPVSKTLIKEIKDVEQ